LLLAQTDDLSDWKESSPAYLPEASPLPHTSASTDQHVHIQTMTSNNLSSTGSVATQLRCSGILNDHIIAKV